jgi:hypothetical protein
MRSSVTHPVGIHMAFTVAVNLCVSPLWHDVSLALHASATALTWPLPAR